MGVLILVILILGYGSAQERTFNPSKNAIELLYESVSPFENSEPVTNWKKRNSVAVTQNLFNAFLPAQTVGKSDSYELISTSNSLKEITDLPDVTRNRRFNPGSILGSLANSWKAKLNIAKAVLNSGKAKLDIGKSLLNAIGFGHSGYDVKPRIDTDYSLEKNFNADISFQGELKYNNQKRLKRSRRSMVKGRKKKEKNRKRQKKAKNRKRKKKGKKKKNRKNKRKRDKKKRKGEKRAGKRKEKRGKKC